MTATGATARAVLTTAVTALLLVLGTVTARADLEPGPTTLTVTAERADAAQVIATGTLVDSGDNPVPDAPIEARLDGEAVASATTGDEGTYTLSFTLPDEPSGEQQVEVVFSGVAELEPATATAPLPAPATPSPEPSPTDTRLDVFLDVSIAPATVTAGSLVTIEGTLTDENDAPIEGARIKVLLDDEESLDSRVQTGDGGTFRTFAEIPSGRSSGAGSLVVTFAGNGSYTPGLKRFDVAVEDLPDADDAASPESPESTGTGQDGASMEAAASATAAANEEDPDVADRSPLSWFYVALIVVGGAALLVTAGLAFRGMYGRRDTEVSEDGRDLEPLLAPDPDADDEERAFLSDAFGEEVEDPTIDGEDPAESSADRHDGQ